MTQDAQSWNADNGELVKRLKSYLPNPLSGTNMVPLSQDTLKEIIAALSRQPSAPADSVMANDPVHSYPLPSNQVRPSTAAPYDFEVGGPPTTGVPTPKGNDAVDAARYRRISTEQLRSMLQDKYGHGPGLAGGSREQIGATIDCWQIQDSTDQRNAPRWTPPIPEHYVTAPSDVVVPSGYKLLKDSTFEERRWLVDVNQENGNYYCTCFVCQRSFMGHKRRQICKVCDTEEQNPHAAISTPPHALPQAKQAGQAETAAPIGYAAEPILPDVPAAKAPNSPHIKDCV